MPYNNKGRNEAQFQLGYKGFIQLAIRTGQYKKINVTELYEGQFESYDPITDELKYNLDGKISDEVTHYIAYVLKLLLSKFGILSIEMQTAQKVDQAVIKEVEPNGNVEVEYVDSPGNASDIVEEETADNDTQSDDEIVENFNSEELF